MKIVYLYTDLHKAGGIERITIQKMNYLAEVYKYEVHCILISDGKKPPYYPLSEKVIVHYLNIQYYPSKRLKHFVQKYLFDRKQHRIQQEKTEKLLSEIQPTICISVYMNQASHFLYKIHPESKKIIEFHQGKWGGLMEYKESKYPWLTKFLLTRLINKQDDLVKKYDAFVVLTHEDTHQWSSQKNISVIPNFTDFVTTFKDLYPDYSAKKVICAGRVTDQQHKGFDLLIKSWAIINQKFPDWKLSIVGRHPEKRDSLDTLITAYGLQDRISVEYMTDTIEKYYANHSIFVMSSRYEGFGIVLIEAASCGLPLVSFDCPSGPNEIIKDHEDGYLAEAENYHDLAEKLGLLMQSEEKRSSFGHKAKQNVHRFSPEEVMKQWNKLFIQVTQS